MSPKNKNTNKATPSPSSSKAEVKRLKAENAELKLEIRALRTKLDQILAKLAHMTRGTPTSSPEDTATTPVSSITTTPPPNTNAPSPPNTDSMEVDQPKLPPMNLDTGGILAKRHRNLEAINIEVSKKSKKESDATPGPSQPPTSSNTPNKSANPNTINPQKRTTKPPAIIAENVQTKALVAELKNKLGHGEFMFQTVNPKKKRIQVNSKESHGKVLEILKEQKIESFSYTPKDERPTTLLLKKVCCTYDKDDVAAALKAAFPSTNFSRVEKFEVPPRYLKTNPGRYKDTNIWQLTVPPRTDIRAITKTTTLDEIKQVVSFEVYRTEDIPFCRNCKEWNHTKNNCQKLWRCSRCTTDHALGQCQVPEATFDSNGVQSEASIPSCRNCGKKGHPASYRCEVYKRIKKFKEMAKGKREAATTQKATFVSEYTQKGVSYSDRLKPKPAAKPTTPSHTPQPIPPCTLPPTTNQSNLTNTDSNADTPLTNPKTHGSGTFISFESIKKMFKLANDLKPQFDLLEDDTEKQALIGCKVFNLVLNNEW